MGLPVYIVFEAAPSFRKRFRVDAMLFAHAINVSLFFSPMSYKHIAPPCMHARPTQKLLALPCFLIRSQPDIVPDDVYQNRRIHNTTIFDSAGVAGWDLENRTLRQGPRSMVVHLQVDLSAEDVAGAKLIRLGLPRVYLSTTKRELGYAEVRPNTERFSAGAIRRGPGQSCVCE